MQNAAVVNARKTSTMTACPVAPRAPSRNRVTRTFTRVGSEHCRGERLAAARESLERQIPDVQGVCATVEHLLDDQLRGRGRVHETVTGKAGGDVETRDPGYRADHRVVVRRHLVIAGPRVGDAHVREERMPPRRTRAHPGLE